MLVPVSGIMDVGMRMTRTVCMGVDVFVEHNFQASAKSIGDTTESFEAWDMVAALQPRNHRFGHTEPPRQLLLRLTGVAAEFEQLASTLSSKRSTIVGSAAARLLRVFHALA